MSKGDAPAGPRPPRPTPIPLGNNPGGGPPGAPQDPCSAEVDLEANLEVTLQVGTSVTALVAGGKVVLLSAGKRIGTIPEPDDAVVLVCSQKGWVYQGDVLVTGPSPIVRLSGRRP